MNFFFERERKKEKATLVDRHTHHTYIHSRILNENRKKEFELIKTF